MATLICRVTDYTGNPKALSNVLWTFGARPASVWSEGTMQIDNEVRVPKIGDMVGWEGYDRVFQIVEVTPLSRSVRLKALERDVTTGQIAWDQLVFLAR